MKFKSFFFIVLFALSGFVVGCASEPSEADIRGLVEKDVSKAASMAAGMKGIFNKFEVHSVKKIGCKEATDSTGYYCDFEVDFDGPFGRVQETKTALFIKTKEGWTGRNSQK